MNKKEQQRKSVPGGRDIVMEIKKLSEGILNLDSEIQNCQQKIKDIIATNKANSPLKNLKDEEKEIIKTFDQLRTEKQNYLEELRNHKTALDSLREDCNAKGIRRPMNLEEIQRQIEDLNLKLISNSVSLQEEKEIAAKYDKLRTERGKLNKIDDNRKSMEDIELLYSSTKASISDLNDKIAKQKVLKENVQGEISKIEKALREKTPEILKLEGKITAFISKKKALIEEKLQKKEALKVIEKEYAEFEVYLNEQRDIEGKRDAIKKEIGDLRNEKETILKSLRDIDPQLINSLIYSINELKKRGETRISLNIVHSLMKLGIKIPLGVSEMEKTVMDLEVKKMSFAGAYSTRKTDADAKIEAISTKILEKMKELEGLPVTDYDVFKKDAFKFKMIKN